MVHNAIQCSGCQQIKFHRMENCFINWGPQALALARALCHQAVCLGKHRRYILCTRSRVHTLSTGIIVRYPDVEQNSSIFAKQRKHQPYDIQNDIMVPKQTRIIYYFVELWANRRTNGDGDRDNGCIFILAIKIIMVVYLSYINKLCNWNYKKGSDGSVAAAGWAAPGRRKWVRRRWSGRRCHSVARTHIHNKHASQGISAETIPVSQMIFDYECARCVCVLAIAKISFWSQHGNYYINATIDHNVIVASRKRKEVMAKICEMCRKNLSLDLAFMLTDNMNDDDDDDDVESTGLL